MKLKKLICCMNKPPTVIARRCTGFPGSIFNDVGNGDHLIGGENLTDVDSLVKEEVVELPLTDISV